MKTALVSCALATLSLCASAHDGHGLAGTHWHATDVWGFVALGAAAAVAFWAGRKK
ncbi:MAG TPA: hypothetical protein VGP22_03810 [Albitalea sp.]|jgi:hypothetical protein|nr:hypothetical protein [Albitalea sp.]